MSVAPAFFQIAFMIAVATAKTAKITLVAFSGVVGKVVLGVFLFAVFTNQFDGVLWGLCALCIIVVAAVRVYSQIEDVRTAADFAAVQQQNDEKAAALAVAQQQNEEKAKALAAAQKQNEETAIQLENVAQALVATKDANREKGRRLAEMEKHVVRLQAELDQLRGAACGEAREP
jgi:hypothetical protein